MKNKDIEYKKQCINLIKTIFIISICTIISIFLEGTGIREENIVMTYLLGVVTIVMVTKGYAWGIFSSVISVGCFNLLFISPRYTFLVQNPNYIITFIIFICVSVITSRFISQLHGQVIISKNNEDKSKYLYEMSKSYLNISGIDNIIVHAIKTIYYGQKHRCVIYLNEEGIQKFNPYYLDEYKDEIGIIEDLELAKWCHSHGIECSDNKRRYFIPIVVMGKCLGVVCVYLNDKFMSKDERFCIYTVISQMKLALEKELLYSQQENIRIEVEKEKLRSNLLRSISHDLRTPLTGISGLSGFIVESYEQLDRDTVKGLVSDIESDAVWLNKLVENLLNMTRIQDGKLTIKKEYEVIDDILTEAIRRAAKIKKRHDIRIKMPEELLLVPMDGKLIIQVLINLLDNAIKHTNDTSTIIIDVHKTSEFAIFEVSDNGGGIGENMIDTIFDSFISSTENKSDNSRGIGLGLSICKSIIEAHNGKIEGFNNTKGGATFRFMLPL